MNLYLVRHAESLDNKSRVVSHDESYLSQEGVIQARILGKKLSKETKIIEIWTSPLKRAKQTAENIASFYPSLKIRQMKEITEKREASSLIGKTRKEIPWDLIIKKRLNPDWRHEDGESFNDVKKRVKSVLNKLEEYPNDTGVLMVTHNSFIKYFVAFIVLGDRFAPETFYPFADKLETKSGGVTMMERKQKYYEKEPSWYLATWMS